MGTFGWVLVALAFLVFIMVANNSWSAVWNRITGNTTPTGTPPAQNGETTGSGQPVMTGPKPTDGASYPPTPEVQPQNPGRTLVPNPNDPNGPPLEVMG